MMVKVIFKNSHRVGKCFSTKSYSLRNCDFVYKSHATALDAERYLFCKITLNQSFIFHLPGPSIPIFNAYRSSAEYSFGSIPFLKWLETDESQHPANNIKIAWISMVETPNEYSGHTLVLARWILETSSGNWILRSRPGMLFASPTGYEKVKNIGWKMPSKCPIKIREGACPSAKAATFFWHSPSSGHLENQFFNKFGLVTESMGTFLLEEKRRVGLASFCVLYFIPFVLPSQNLCWLQHSASVQSHNSPISTFPQGHLLSPPYWKLQPTPSCQYFLFVLLTLVDFIVFSFVMHDMFFLNYPFGSFISWAPTRTETCEREGFLSAVYPVPVTLPGTWGVLVGWMKLMWQPFEHELDWKFAGRGKTAIEMIWPVIQLIINSCLACKTLKWFLD